MISGIKKTNHRFALIFLAVLLVFNLFPLLLLAADSGGLVTCGTGEAGPAECTWPKLVEMFKKITNFIFVDLMIPLAVIAIVYVGVKILLAQDKPGELKNAYKTLQNVGIGIFLALGAYAIVKTILTLLLSQANPDNTLLSDVINQVF